MLKIPLDDFSFLTFILGGIPRIKLFDLNNFIIRDIIKYCPQALRHIENQTPEICLAVVQHNGWALQYVENQTPEICLAAVQQKGLALEYVEVQTPEICLAAVQQNEWAIQHIRDPLIKRMIKLSLVGGE